jgi:hypothetical protein
MSAMDWNAARHAMVRLAMQARTREELAELYLDLATRAPDEAARVFWRDAAQRSGADVGRGE